MAQTPAQRQAAYRQRHLRDGTESRISIVVSATAKAGLERLAVRYGVTQREALERALRLAEEQALAEIDPARHGDYYEKRASAVTT